MPRGSFSGREASLLRSAFHGAYGRKLVRCMLDQFSEIQLFVVSTGPSTARIGYCKLSSLGSAFVIPSVQVCQSSVK